MKSRYFLFTKYIAEREIQCYLNTLGFNLFQPVKRERDSLLMHLETYKRDLSPRIRAMNQVKGPRVTKSHRLAARTLQALQALR